MTAPDPAAAAALDDLCRAFGLDARQREALRRYLGAILGWPGNVTGLREPAAIVSTLFGDALALLDVPELDARAGARWVDLGAGAGVPGIPLAVASPGVHLTALEAARRKCAFLARAVEAAGLAGRAEVLCARSEEAAAPGAAGREAFDVVLTRAVGALPVVVELAAPLLRRGGVLLAVTGAAAAAGEAPRAAAAAPRVGLAAGPCRPLPRSPLATSVCCVFTKVAPTPDRFPRRPGLAARRPLA